MKFKDIYKATAYLKDMLPEYLERKGLPTSGHERFTCLNPNHADKHPSMSYYKKGQKCHCFACGVNYDIFAIIGIDYQLDSFSEQLRKACELFDVEIESAAPQFEEDYSALKEEENHWPEIRQYMLAFEGSPAEEYLHSRGISTSTAIDYRIGYNRKENQLVIPTGNMYTATMRSLDIAPDDKSNDKNRRYRNLGNSSLFNPKAITESDQPVIITEGEIDALSAIENGIPAAALGSVANVDMFVKYVKTNKPTQPLILSLDRDEKGQAAEVKLAAALRDLGVEFYQLNITGDKGKDLNEALRNDKAFFSARIWMTQTTDGINALLQEQRQEYRKQNSVAGKMESFYAKITENSLKKPISTGFPSLDKALDGGIYKGLYIIGAESSVGKTTFILQLADQIAQAGHDVMFFSLEMSRDELIAKSISRLTVQIANAETGRRDFAMTARGILDGSRYSNFSKGMKERFQQAVDKYSKFNDRIFIHEVEGKIGIEEIRTAIEQHKDNMGTYPIVFIDYLQLLKPYNDRASDKQSVDYNVSILRQISRNLPIFAISSLNRESYKTSSSNKGRIGLADFKESGAIEYSADVIIALQLAEIEGSDIKDAGKILDAKKEAMGRDTREISAVILKNRLASVGERVPLEFIPMFNWYREPKEKKL